MLWCLAAFAAVALAIAVIGVAGVLVFSVSGRTREFGIRLALGAQPRNLLTSVIADGAVMAGVGIAAGALCGYAIARLASSYIVDVRMPGVLRRNCVGGGTSTGRGRGVFSSGGAGCAHRCNGSSAVGISGIEVKFQLGVAAQAVEESEKNHAECRGN